MLIAGRKFQLASTEKEENQANVGERVEHRFFQIFLLLNP